MAGRTGEVVRPLLLTRAADYAHPDPHTAVRTAVRIALDSLSWRTAFGIDFAAADDESPEQWTEQLCALCRTSLMTPPA